MLSRFKPVVGPALVLVPTKLVKNWQAEYAKFFDTDNSKQNLKVYIRYRSATLNKRIRTTEEKMMITPKGIQPTINASKYLIITLSTSYKKNVLFYFSTHKIGFVTMLEKKKREFYSKSIAQDMWGQIFRDKYYKEKRKETKRISLCLNTYATYCKAKI